MTEKPYAMVPLGPNGGLVRVEFGQEIEFSNNMLFEPCLVGHFTGYSEYRDTYYCIIDDCLRARTFARLPCPKRPEIAVDEPVWVSNSRGNWTARHFKSWGLDGVVVWVDGYTSHTTKVSISYYYVKTKDGRIWPPEVEG